MGKDITKRGVCSICGCYDVLTFEHTPPRAAFNDKPMFTQKYEQLIEESSPMFGKKSMSRKGFGDYTLCQSCNNLTGDWYARDFSVFAHQGMKVLSSFKKPQYHIHAEYKIKPLSILKQILSMFMSADKGHSLQRDRRLSSFILNKESNLLPTEYKLYLYSSYGPAYRMMGYSVVGDFDKNEVYKWSEINYKPFGYFLTIDSPPAHESMVDITFFKDYEYGNEAIIRLRTPYLIVESPEIGTYLNG